MEKKLNGPPARQFGSLSVAVCRILWDFDYALPSIDVNEYEKKSSEILRIWEKMGTKIVTNIPFGRCWCSRKMSMKTEREEASGVGWSQCVCVRESFGAQSQIDKWKCCGCLTSSQKHRKKYSSSINNMRQKSFSFFLLFFRVQYIFTQGDLDKKSQTFLNTAIKICSFEPHSFNNKYMHNNCLKKCVYYMSKENIFSRKSGYKYREFCAGLVLLCKIWF